MRQKANQIKCEQKNEIISCLLTLIKSISMDQLNQELHQHQQQQQKHLYSVIIMKFCYQY